MKASDLLVRLLRRNVSPARAAGFVLSNFIGMAIVLGALQFWLDASTLWTGKDSFLSNDWLVVNKRVTASSTLAGGGAAFTEAEIADLESQPWVRGVGRFRANEFRAWAAVSAGEGKSMSTSLFFESLPDAYVDVPASQWAWRPGSDEVPVIMSKDYLALYNFGFAGAAGLPQLSEGLMGSIPLRLRLSSEDGSRTMTLNGRIAGFSNRLNTILVPQDFMETANAQLGDGRSRAPSRLAIDVSRPGDVEINRYLEEHGLEAAGDKSASRAAFLLRVVTGIVLGVGLLITVLSFFILMLSLSLIMEKNKGRLHRLMSLGYDPAALCRPYTALVVWASLAACALAVGGVLGLRAWYLPAVEGLGAVPRAPWAVPVAAALMTLAVIGFNTLAIRRRMIRAWR